MLSRAIRMPAIRRLLVVLVLIVAYQGWLSIQAVGKAEPDVGSSADSHGRFSVDVKLGFAPERFHILQLQKHGRIAGTDGNVVHLRSVSADGVDALARLYWVDHIFAGGRGSGDEGEIDLAIGSCLALVEHSQRNQAPCLT